MNNNVRTIIERELSGIQLRGDDFQTFNGGHHRNSGSNDDFTIEKLPPISPIITSIDVVRADVLRPASDINVRIPPSPALSARITKVRYLMETTKISSQKISDKSQTRHRVQRQNQTGRTNIHEVYITGWYQYRRRQLNRREGNRGQ